MNISKEVQISKILCLRKKSQIIMTQTFTALVKEKKEHKLLEKLFEESGYSILTFY